MDFMTINQSLCGLEKTASPEEISKKGIEASSENIHPMSIQIDKGIPGEAQVSKEINLGYEKS